MMTAVLAVLLTGGLLYVWYGFRARSLAAARLSAFIGPAVAVGHISQPRRVVRTFPPRHRMAVTGTAVLSGVALWLGLGLPLQVAAAAALLIGTLAHLVEDQIGERKTALIEAQLAAAIYLMVASLRAGASLLAAFESALEEIGPPLRPYFQEVAGRIRLGDDPRTAVSDLQASVPLETFRLFATSLAIHWEVGGSLATTLSTVGQTVRDRIELSRRVRAQSVESHASVGVVLAIAYVLGILMWRANPARMEAFIGSSVGTTIVAGVIALQAVGLMWMSRLNRSTF